MQVCLIGLMLAGAASHAQALPFGDSVEAFIPGEIIVQFKLDVTDAEIKEVFRRTKG